MLKTLHCLFILNIILRTKEYICELISHNYYNSITAIYYLLIKNKEEKKKIEKEKSEKEKNESERKKGNIFLNNVKKLTFENSRNYNNQNGNNDSINLNNSNNRYNVVVINNFLGETKENNNSIQNNIKLYNNSNVTDYISETKTQKTIFIDKVPLIFDFFSVLTSKLDDNIGNECIIDKKNGYLIKEFNIEDMAEKIEMLIENKDLRKSFSENALNDIKKFELESIIKKWNNLLERI